VLLGRARSYAPGAQRRPARALRAVLVRLQRQERSAEVPSVSHDARVDMGDDRPVYRRKPTVYGADGFPVVPKSRQRTWEGLRWSEQRAVLRAARRGDSHPDPAMAKAARDWAHAVLAPRTRSRGPLAVLMSLIEDPFGGILGEMFAAARAARRILAVRPPPRSDQPPAS
jgi:hypothetical protein